MKKEKIKSNIIIHKWLYVLIFLFFVMFALRLSYLCLVDYKVGDRVKVTYTGTVLETYPAQVYVVDVEKHQE